MTQSLKHFSRQKQASTACVANSPVLEDNVRSTPAPKYLQHENLFSQKLVTKYLLTETNTYTKLTAFAHVSHSRQSPNNSAKMNTAVWPVRSMAIRRFAE
jgi:hypothetical protein